MRGRWARRPRRRPGRRLRPHNLARRKRRGLFEFVEAGDAGDSRPCRRRSRPRATRRPCNPARRRTVCVRAACRSRRAPCRAPELWQGANLPTELTQGDRIKVTINQTQQKAILTWDTFNVGGKTDLTFDQDGNRDWVALNRVVATDAQPSQILGTLKADGQVYVINRNGIIFGGATQVNVGTLIASALPINESLLNAGTLFGDPNSTKFTFSAYSEIAGDKGPTDAFSAPAATASSQTSKVVVEAGAVISTVDSSGNNGGRVVLIGPEVINKGTIWTPDGQAILAAGQQVALLPHASDDPSLRGLDVYVGSILAPVVGINSPSLATPTSVSGIVTGNATNAGLIVAERGNITIAGANINQLGVLQARPRCRSMAGSICWRFTPRR